MAKKNILDWIAATLLVVGGLNWGLVAFNYNLLQAIIGSSIIVKIIYGLVGLSAIYTIIIGLVKKLK